MTDDENSVPSNKAVFDTIFTNYFVEEVGGYFEDNGRWVKYAPSMLCLLKIPKQNCAFYNVFSSQSGNAPSIIFADKDLKVINFSGLYATTTGSNETLIYDITKVNVPENAAYIIVHTQSRQFKIKTKESLHCTSYEYIKFKQNITNRINESFYFKSCVFNSLVKELYIHKHKNFDESILPLKFIVFSNSTGEKGFGIQDKNGTQLIYRQNLEKNRYYNFATDTFTLHVIFDFSKIVNYSAYSELLDNSYDILYSPTIFYKMNFGFLTSLNRLKICYNGDSIAESRYNGQSNNDGSYPQIISNILKNSFENRAVGGGVLVSQLPNGNTPGHSVVLDIQNMSDDADLICLEGGINDYWNNVPLGNFIENDYTGEVDTTTLIGALESILRQSINKWPGKPICFVIVHKIKDTVYKVNGAGYTFKQAHDKMLSLLKKYSIPVYDAFEESGLNGYIDVLNNNYLTAGSNVEAGKGDGCHPNAEGYKRYYVPQLVDLFRKIIK